MKIALIVIALAAVITGGYFFSTRSGFLARAENGDTGSAEKPGRTNTATTAGPAEPEKGVENRSDAPKDIAAFYSWLDQSCGEGSSTIWSQIAKSGELYVPAVGMKDSLTKAVKDKPGQAIHVSDLESGIHMAQVTQPNGDVVGQAAAYTDIKLLNNQEFIQRVEARAWLAEMLTFDQSNGIVLNPRTRFMRPDYRGPFSSLTRTGVAEMIGFLDAKNDPGNRPFHELANDAFARKSYYEVLYYWARSYRTPRPGDDWKQAEAAKLRSYEALNFPGSRERARGELQWMLKTHPSAQMKALQREFNP